MKKIKRCIDIKDTWLFSGTVRDNLRYSNPNATDEEVMHAADVAQAGDFIRSLPDGLDSYVRTETAFNHCQGIPVRSSDPDPG